MSSSYLPRVVDAELSEYLHDLPAVVIQGLKGVGKTVTAQQVARTSYTLDLEAVRELLLADPTLIESASKPVLLDEWQAIPDLWNRVRRLVDAGAEPGSYLLTGSAPATGTGLHSGAGRMVIVRMRPLSLAERWGGQPTVGLADLLTGERGRLSGSTDVRLEDYVREIVATGLPGLRGLGSRVRSSVLDSYMDLLVSKEIPEQGVVVRRPQAVKAWLRAYAAASSTTASFETIRKSATPGENDQPPSRASTGAYRNVLEALWLLDPIPGWAPTRNRLAKLNQAPKHNLADPGLAAHLLGVNEQALISPAQPGRSLIRDASLLGNLFESLVSQSVRVYAQANQAETFHVRTAGGEHEIDLLITGRNEKAVAIEVKLSATPRPDSVRHLLWLQEQLKTDLLDMVIVTTGTDAYRRPDGIAVVPAALLGP